MSSSNAETRMTIDKKRWSRLGFIGPVVIGIALSMGPGSIISAASAGTSLGYGVIWLIILSSVYGYVYIDMAIRIGVGYPGTSMQTLAKKAGKPVSIIVGVAYYLKTLLVMMGSILGCGIGLNLLFGGDARYWYAATGVAALITVGSKSGYKILEKAIIMLVGVMLVVFGIAVFFAGPDWRETVAGIVPSWIPESPIAILALLGTNLTPYTAFYMTYTIREKGTPKDKYRATTLADTLPSVIVSTLIIVSIFLLGSSLGHGQDVSEASDLADFLTPVVGGAAVIIIGAGVFAAGFSSVLGDFGASGSITTDAFGKGAYLSNKWVRIVGASNLIISLLILMVVETQPELLVIIVNAASIYLIPVLAVALIFLANDRKVLGKLSNNWIQNIVAVIGLLVFLGSAVELGVSTFS